MIVATRASPLRSTVSAPIERCDTVSVIHESPRYGVEAPSNIEKSMAKHDIDRSVPPTNDVVLESVRDECRLRPEVHAPSSSNLRGESAWDSRESGAPARASAISLAVSGASRIPFR